MVKDFADEYRRYRILGEKALAQMPDAALDVVPSPEGNSAGMIVRHVSGNLKSRFTDFRTSDGEKPWRDREAEFAERSYSRSDVDTMWADGFAALTRALDGLTDDDLERSVAIRGQPLTVHQALARSVAHLAYHVGQLVLLAREHAERPWETLSIARGGSAAYNANPTMERGPR